MLKMGDGYSTDEKYQRVEQVLNDVRFKQFYFIDDFY